MGAVIHRELGELKFMIFNEMRAMITR